MIESELRGVLFWCDDILLFIILTFYLVAICKLFWERRDINVLS